LALTVQPSSVSLRAPINVAGLFEYGNVTFGPRFVVTGQPAMCVHSFQLYVWYDVQRPGAHNPNFGIPQWCCRRDNELASGIADRSVFGWMFGNWHLWPNSKVLPSHSVRFAHMVARNVLHSHHANVQLLWDAWSCICCTGSS